MNGDDIVWVARRGATGVDYPLFFTGCDQTFDGGITWIHIREAGREEPAIANGDGTNIFQQSPPALFCTGQKFRGALRVYLSQGGVPWLDQRG